jgi:hypothetical protein
MTDVLPRGQCVNIKAKRTGAGFAVKGLEGCNPRIAAELKPQASKRRVKWSSHDVEAKISAGVGWRNFLPRRLARTVWRRGDR